MKNEIIQSVARSAAELCMLADASDDPKSERRLRAAERILSDSLPVAGVSVNADVDDLDMDGIAADLQEQFHALCDERQYAAAHVVNHALTVLTLVN
ncbi:hypothetical protein [Bifidobacterium thermophilum]|uniref:hypothetical protein n=1 Tax=Bifidobacterium thermophilum TaxID=33905 RepID=UPI003F90920E